jgi:hypothetical protein
MKKFVIKEGRHYCEWFWTKVFHPHYDHQHWDGIFRLDRSCWWHPARDGNDYDINKIIGVSFGLWHHRNNVVSNRKMNKKIKFCRKSKTEEITLNKSL